MRRIFQNSIQYILWFVNERFCSSPNQASRLTHRRLCDCRAHLFLAGCLHDPRPETRLLRHGVRKELATTLPTSSPAVLVISNRESNGQCSGSCGGGTHELLSASCCSFYLRSSAAVARSYTTVSSSPFTRTWIQTEGSTPYRTACTHVHLLSLVAPCDRSLVHCVSSWLSLGIQRNIEKQWVQYSTMQILKIVYSDEQWCFLTLQFIIEVCSELAACIRVAIYCITQLGLALV
jgi:hypothetical protein